MKIELKKVKLCPNMSDETNAFTAEIYLDGVRSIYAKDNGCGGSIEMRDLVPGSGATTRLYDYCKTLPPVDCSDIRLGETLKMNAELYIGQMIEALLNEKEDAKARRKFDKDRLTRIMYTRKDKPGVWEIKLKPGTTWLDISPASVALFREKDQNIDVILNELPEDQGFETLQKRS